MKFTFIKGHGFPLYNIICCGFLGESMACTIDGMYMLCKNFTAIKDILIGFSKLGRFIIYATFTFNLMEFLMEKSEIHERM